MKTEYRLEEICYFINGGAWTEKEYKEEGIPVIKVSNIKGESISFENMSYLSESSLNKYKKNLLKENDLVVATVGSHPNLENSAAGRSIVISKDYENYLLNQNAVCIRTKNNEVLDQKYLGYLSKTKSFLNFIQVRGAGAANQMRIPIGAIKSFKINIPENQKKIAKKLSNYDDLIENNQKQIELLEKKAQLTYEEWFLRFRIDGKKLDIDEESGLPFGWERIKVKKLLGKVKSTSKIKTSEILENGRFPVIDQSRDFIAGYTNEENIHYFQRNGYIVFGDHTRILKFINFTFAKGADGTQVLVSNNERMPQVLFYHSLIKIDLSNYHYARHYKFLKEEEVLLPSIEYSNKYKVLGNLLFENIKKLRDQNQKLKKARDILLPRLMSGMIEV